MSEDKNDPDEQDTIDYWSKLAQLQHSERRENMTEYRDQIKKRLLSIEDEMQSLKSSLELMQSQSSQMLTIVTELREDMMNLKEAHRVQEHQELPLREWIENKMGLPQYFELLMDNGFEDLESLKDITMEHLREMGIEEMGHRLKLMKAAYKV